MIWTNEMIATRQRMRAEGAGTRKIAEALGVSRTSVLCREWYERNLEEARAKNARWYAENPEKVRAAVAKWQAENPEKVRAAVAKWQAENPEKVRAAKREYYRRKKAAKMNDGAKDF